MNQQALRLMTILADGHRHSGECLGRELGISRAAIWKLVSQLRDQGVEIECLRGQGYWIPNGIEFLSAKKIEALLAGDVRSRITKLEVQQSITSTNQVLLDAIKEEQSPIHVCFAEHQTAGRGRRGRTWLSPFGKNLYFSLSWRFSNGPASTQGLALVIGLGIVDVLSTLGITGLNIKWPNDVFYKDKKLAGVLIEMHLDSCGFCHVVIGVGLNISLTEKIKNDLQRPVTDLQTILKDTVDRNVLAAMLLNHFIEQLQQFSVKGFAEFASRWPQWDQLYQQPIMLQLMDRQLTGIALGIDETGGLRVQQDNDICIYHAGEVSVRKKDFAA